VAALSARRAAYGFTTTYGDGMYSEYAGNGKRPSPANASRASASISSHALTGRRIL
jgi:hypothetical protein